MRLADLNHKTICIMGYAREGQAVLRAIERLGLTCEVTISDINPDLGETPKQYARQIGEGWLENLEKFDVIIKAPGVPPNPKIEAVRSKITSATQLFFDEAQALGATVIGITGSKGKSTTTALIHAILKGAGLDSHLVGNIGVAALDELPKAKPNAIFVHELSSYQLADSKIRPNVAVTTAFFPEHLDYHGSLEAYFEAKTRIARFQEETDTIVFNASSPECERIAALSKGRKIAVTAKDAPVTLDEIKLRGTHNLGNIALASAVGDLFAVRKETQISIIQAFTGLPHRLQVVGVMQDIEWIDDAISTTPESAIAALDALGQRVRTIILGGQDRGVDFTTLGQRLAHSSVRTVVLFPGSGPRIRTAIEAAKAKVTFIEADSMASAVNAVVKHTPKEDPPAIGLLSTASPSYGMFKNFEQKGDEFQACIRHFEAGQD